MKAEKGKKTVDTYALSCTQLSQIQFLINILSLRDAYI